MWLLWVVLAILVLGALFAGGSDWLAHDPWSLVELRKLPRSTVARAFGEGVVRLVGVVRDTSGQRRTVILHTIVEELQRHGDRIPGLAETTWVRTTDDMLASDFWLDDGTGRAYVLAAGAAIRPQLVHARYRLANEDAERRCFEAAIVEGDRIAVCGYATWEEGPGGTTVLPGEAAPEIAGRRLVIRAGERSPIVVSDDPALLEDEPRI